MKPGGSQGVATKNSPMASACYAHGPPMTFQGRRTIVYVCGTCGKRGCGIPGCQRRGQKSGVWSGCQGTVFILAKRAKSGALEAPYYHPYSRPPAPCPVPP